MIEDYIKDRLENGPMDVHELINEAVDFLEEDKSIVDDIVERMQDDGIIEIYQEMDVFMARLIEED